MESSFFLSVGHCWQKLWKIYFCTCSHICAVICFSTGPFPLAQKKILPFLFSHRDGLHSDNLFFLGGGTGEEGGGRGKFGYMVWEVNFCKIWDLPSLSLKARPFLWDSWLLVLFRLRDRTTAQERIEHDLNLSIRHLTGGCITTLLFPGPLPVAFWLLRPSSHAFYFSIKSWNSYCPPKLLLSYFLFILYRFMGGITGGALLWELPEVMGGSWASL